MNRIIHIALLLLIAISLGAQIPFTKSILLKGNLPSTTEVNFVKMVDLDGDGDNDVVAAVKENYLVWYENLDGQGTFGYQNLISDRNLGIIGLDTGDMDGDGLIDVLIVSEKDEGILWFRNENKGVISSEINFITFNQDGISTATIMDLDSDGDNDVVFGFTTAFNFTKPLQWCENLSNTGSFSNPILLSNFTQQAGSYPLGYGDFDGNGALDICVSGNSSLRVYYNDGAQSFEIENVFTDSGVGKIVNILDYDGDEDLDIIIGTENIVWHQNNMGDFSAPILLYDKTISALQHDDFDGDGDLDLATFSELDSSIVWLENQGLNNPVVIHEVNSELIYPQRATLGDLDGDNDIDIVVSTSPGHLARLINTDGQGGFVREDDVNAQLLWVSDMRSADIDGDGDLDALISDKAGGRIDWYENVNGDGSRMQQHNIIYEFDGASSLVDADVDGDGDTDVIGIAGNQPNLLWFENTDGAGNFSKSKLIAENLGSDHYLEAADLDGDSDIDIVLTLESGKKMLLFTNLGGFFDEGIEIFDIPHEFTATILADIDNDGDLDIVATQKSIPRIFWAENLFSSGAFSELRIIMTETESMNNIHATDVDGDLDLDLVYTQNDALKWIEHLDGIGSFGEAIEIDKLVGQNINYNQLEVTDLDSDGDEDILLIGTDGLFWYENLGFKSGRWSPVNHIDEEPLVYCYAADFSGDDVNDILAFSLTEKTLYTYQNNLPPQNFITGYINNENLGACTIADNPIEGLLVSSTNGAEVFSSYTNRNGQFLNKVPLGEYTTMVSNLPVGYSVDPAAHMSSIAASNRKDTINYCIETNSVDSMQNNLSVHMFLLSQEARPGFDVTYQLVYRNRGTTTHSDTILLTYQNEVIDYLTASVDPDAVTDGTIRWIFDNLAPFESKKVNIKFNIKPPPIANISDILNFNAKIGLNINDVQPENNTYDYFHFLVGSFDPNDITVLEGPEIRYDNYLRPDTVNYLNYIIRFQNTGTASAINVRLANAIDQNLDWTTLDIISSSHNYRAEIRNQDTLDVFYDGIYLPDSDTDLEGSQGYLIYQIKMKEGLNAGTKILNDAEIYFDFNEAIFTNQVSTQLTQLTSTSSIAQVNKPIIYPNPSLDWVYIQHEESIESYEVYDIHGTLLHTILGSNKIDLQLYPKAVYLIKLRDSLGRLYTLKLTKI